MESAAAAGARHDMCAMTEALAAAVAAYEECPSEAHGSLSEIRKLLAFLHYARRLRRTLGLEDGALQDLQRRANALTQALH
jgi:hypothetical protein